MREAIIDNDTLVNLTDLGAHLAGTFNAISQLRNLFTKIHIPVEIKNEYERGAAFLPYRQKVLARLRPDEGFLSLCTHYDLVVKAIIQTKRLPGNDYLKDRDSVFTALLKIRPFKAAELREAYRRVARHYGLHIDKRTLSHKCSIKRLHGL